MITVEEENSMSIKLKVSCEKNGMIETIEEVYPLNDGKETIIQTFKEMIESRGYKILVERGEVLDEQ